MRKHQAEKRDVLPDPVYNSKLVTRAVNKLMIDGKRGVAQTILYGAFEIIKEKTNTEPLEIFNKAIANITPHLELKVRRIGGANYQVPIEVNEERKVALSLRWLINYSRLRNEKSMVDKLAHEIIDASNGIGGSVKKKDDTHKMAEANKAFAHYRW
ncbi:30S ribosomal protein S7 [Spiroplasma syrphidicola EA-1]|uniref:Small ribosomal subunit protein uS7 n=1 Tax=Spiroplasma syrphidicola EA-1 TaxID=1276229 RepID=R4U2S8_9MOLU|nr:30S ribosomal protein S7 [Spiroplasma syrphidicola]AGM25672.1 30S ribosomal protein S7 [Spiroplasma syrphidicola EA-1]